MRIRLSKSRFYRACVGEGSRVGVLDRFVESFNVFVSLVMRRPCARSYRMVQRELRRWVETKRERTARYLSSGELDFCTRTYGRGVSVPVVLVFVNVIQ